MRLVSYNVLANAYVKPEYYLGSEPEALDPVRRRKLLIRRIHGLKADILCLQEAEPDLIQELNMPGRFFQKGRDKPDGCAILVNRPGPLRWTEHAYEDGSGHGALLLHLPEITIATTHLKWDPPASRPGWGMGQIGQLLGLLQGPSLLCGDFNCESNDPIIQRCLEAGLTDAFREVAPAHTFVNRGEGWRIDFVLHSYAVKAQALPMPELTPDQLQPSRTEPSDHLPLVVELQDL